MSGKTDIRRPRYYGLDKVYAALKMQPCTDCGLIDPEIIEFDHVPERGPRLGPLGSFTVRGAKAFAEEALKCDPICPNCHVRRTKQRRQNPGRKRQH